MTVAKPGRGRPKGTGLDDSAQLKAIAELIAANPDLRPTTAIKDLGITDPSVIRRLRDKFHATQAGTACISSVAPEAAQHRTMASSGRRERTLSAPAPAREDGDGGGDDSDRDRASETTSFAPSSGRRRDRGGEFAFAKLFGISVGVLVSAIEAQATVGAYCLRHAPVGAVFQTQVAFAEAALTFAAELITPVTLA